MVRADVPKNFLFHVYFYRNATFSNVDKALQCIFATVLYMLYYYIFDLRYSAHHLGDQCLNIVLWLL